MVSIMSRGVSIGYSRGDPKLLIEDMQELKPTMVPMVARMMQKIYDKVRTMFNISRILYLCLKVMNGISEKGKLFEFLFKIAINAKIKEREK